MSKMSEIHADLWSANDNYYGYTGKIGQPYEKSNSVYVLVSYKESEDKFENLYAYSKYEMAWEAKLQAERLNKEGVGFYEKQEYFIDVLEILDN